MERHQTKEVATNKISTDDSPPITSAAEKTFPGVPGSDAALLIVAGGSPGGRPGHRGPERGTSTASSLGPSGRRARWPQWRLDGHGAQKRAAQQAFGLISACMRRHRRHARLRHRRQDGDRAGAGHRHGGPRIRGASPSRPDDRRRHQGGAGARAAGRRPEPEVDSGATQEG